MTETTANDLLNRDPSKAERGEPQYNLNQQRILREALLQPDLSVPDLASHLGMNYRTVHDVLQRADPNVWFLELIRENQRLQSDPRVVEADD